MIAIAIDDEPLMLGALTKAIKASPDISSVAYFSSCEDALDFIKNNHADIAFLDINMRGMGGLSLAEKISDFCPDCKIVFCTGYNTLWRTTAHGFEPCRSVHFTNGYNPTPVLPHVRGACSYCVDSYKKEKLSICLFHY